MAVLLLFVLLLPLVVPTAMWFSHARRAAPLWPRVQVGTQRIDEGSYRAAEVPVYGHEGIPLDVRAAAVGSWVLGTMFVPGLLAGLVGLFMAGLGLVSIPGLILAWRLFFLGRELLEGAPGSSEKARNAARFAQVLNAIVLGLCAIGVAVELAQSGMQGLNALNVAIPVSAYALLSLGHARLLQLAAKHIDARDQGLAMEGMAAPSAQVRIDAAGAPDEVSSLSAVEEAERMAERALADERARGEG